MGYGNQNLIYLKGGVLENRPDFDSKVTDKIIKNFRIMLSRYLSSPIPEMKVQISLGEENFFTQTDEYGYFSAWVEPSKSFEAGWHSVIYSLKNENNEIYKAKGEFLIVGKDAEFATISDIDDTILVSHATQLYKKFRLIMTKNAKTRLPFEGVAEFYQKLKAHENPFFYVSSSEWNLYDFLLDFFTIQNIPKGPFLLQEYKSGLRDLLFTGGGSHQHKQDKIRRLMLLFPKLNFILIGDSGQRDTEIYRQILHEFSSRILAVYIRKIGKKDDFDETTTKEFEEKGVPLLMLENTEEAENHAKKSGFIMK
ncbi:App1 family protein [Marivirga sp.]|uniref:App1 family protein n=1 Tax=Marivirga sp. TaxID=2018662 RepID=UPI002D80AB0B|nr:phosphatase domain-containing protein [Marivirga sp.]HET8861609.1 phosphatase domain-containing protein [Marivirga sp.]